MYYITSDCELRLFTPPNADRTNKGQFKQGFTPWNKGKKMPEGFGEKISKMLKGHKPWNRGLKGWMKHTEEWKKELSRRYSGATPASEFMERLRSMISFSRRVMIFCCSTTVSFSL